MMTIALILTYRWVIFGLLGLLLVVQLYGLLSKKDLPRRNLKFFLNLLLLLVLLLFVLNPGWKVHRSEEKTLIYSEEISQEMLKKSQDDQGVTKTLSRKEAFERPEKLIGKEIVLLGKGFQAEDLSRLEGERVSWEPGFQKNKIQGLAWAAVLRKGERQTVKGQIDLEKESVIKLMLGHQILDSMVLKPGLQQFQLNGVAVAEGRNQWELVLEEKPIQTIRFYASPTPELNILSLQDFPNMESRMLNEWLGRQGHKISALTKVAKDAVFETEVNRKLNTGKPDLILAPPSNHADSRIRQALSDGRAVLFYGFSDMPEQLRAINRSLGTGFGVVRSSGAYEDSVGGELTAQPYRFLDHSRQINHSDIYSALENKIGKVGVSGLNETFPLQLSGDSLRYNHIWSEMVAAFYPVDTGRIKLDAPVFKDVETVLNINPDFYANSVLNTGSDTVYTRNSSINSNKNSAVYTFRNPGWQELNDVEVFVEEDNSVAYLKQWIKHNESLSQSSLDLIDNKHLPDWIWFVMILTVLGVIWLEAKL